MRRSQSPKIAIFLLRGIEKPTDLEVRSLAKFLDSPESELKHAFVKRLGEWYAGPPIDEPKDSMDSAGKVRREYPGLDATIAFWKREWAKPLGPNGQPVSGRDLGH